MSEVQIDHSTWVVKYVGQVVGASTFLLPFAVGQAGWLTFLVILGLEAYYTCNSLILFSEMAAGLPTENGELYYTNYFIIIERYLPGTGWIARWGFIFDLVICTSFYFKTAFELVYLSCLADLTAPRSRSAYAIISFICIALFLAIFEYVSDYVARRKNEHSRKDVHQGASPKDPAASHQTAMNKTEVHLQGKSKMENLIINNHVSLSPQQPAATMRRGGINMRAVVERLHGYNWKKFFLLLLLSFLFCAQSTVSWELWHDDSVSAQHVSFNACLGFRQPVIWKGIDVQIWHVIPIIIFSLMHYAIFLPVCLDELRLPTTEYAKLVKKATLILVLIVSAIPFVASFTLGESAPVLFTTAYGCNIYGKLFNFLAFFIAINAMLLRIMGSCRLIQVLFGRELDSHYWVVVVLLFLISYFVASISPSVLHLVIIAGTFNSNILLIIIPRLAYVRFCVEKMSSFCESFHCHVSWNLTAAFYALRDRWSVLQVIFTIIIHVLLLLTTGYALCIANPDIGQSCRRLFNLIWSPFE